MVDDGGNGEGGNRLEEEYGGILIPGIGMGPTIPHYYGDHVRRLFFFASIALLIIAPFLASTHPVTVPFAIGGIVVLVTLAALTNPKKTATMIANAVTSGFAVLIFEMIALSAYAQKEWTTFIVCEVLAILFLFALYFSLKTVRAMMLGVIGKRHQGGAID